MGSTIERIYSMYRDEKNESPEVGAVADAVKELEKELKGLPLARQSNIFGCASVYAQESEKQGFEAGFKMAWRVLQELQGEPTSALTDKAENDAPEAEKPLQAAVPCCQRAVAYAADVAYARISKDTRWGARLCFNKVSATYLGGARRCDIYVEGGNILVYPDDNGHYAITKVGNTEQRTIACGAIIKNLVRDGCRCAVIPAENHIIVRVA